MHVVTHVACTLRLRALHDAPHDVPRDAPRDARRDARRDAPRDGHVTHHVTHAACTLLCAQGTEAIPIDRGDVITAVNPNQNCADRGAEPERGREGRHPRRIQGGWVPRGFILRQRVHVSVGFRENELKPRALSAHPIHA